MQRKGVRRLLVISGALMWCQQQAQGWQHAVGGDWLWLAQATPDRLLSSANKHRNQLGRENGHVVMDMHAGFQLDSLAVLAGTIRAGCWLVLLVPTWNAWRSRPDADSCRWANVSQPISTPNFIAHLQHSLLQDPLILLLRQGTPLRVRHLPNWPSWRCQAHEQQQSILQHLLAMADGVAIVTAPRGRGKSALAGMLAKQHQRVLTTAPSRAAAAIVAQFAGSAFHFIAPDALLAAPPIQQYEWLVIDEAAALPLPLLNKMVTLFPKTLLTTTVQGYEGSGHGFVQRFCPTLQRARYFCLTQPLRWAVHDPLERWLNQLCLLAAMPSSEVRLPATARQFTRITEWQQAPRKMQLTYQLLAQAHYRTSPLDLRRMMDASGNLFYLAEAANTLQAAIWSTKEGGLARDLAWAVWAGYRRPRGNLVAQSLAAHAGFMRAATLKSVRIHRLAVKATSRRQGVGRHLVALAASYCHHVDYLSVSFGFTAQLWAFWQVCGFHIVRVGNQLDASSGCYSVMALRACSAAGQRLVAHMRKQFCLDGFWHPLADQLIMQRPTAQAHRLTTRDWYTVAGFSWGQRPLVACYAALQRMLTFAPAPLPILRARLHYTAIAKETAPSIFVGGKQEMDLLRSEAADGLRSIDAARAQRWQWRLRHWQQRYGKLPHDKRGANGGTPAQN